MAGATFVSGVVAFCATFNLAAPARQYGGVHIQGDGIELQFVKAPSVAAGVYATGAGLVKALKQAHDGFMACGFTPAKQAHQSAVQAGDVSVGKSGRTAPDADDHLFDELLWAVPPIGAGLG